MSKWKIVGLAGVVGVVATGAVIAHRRKRQWQDYEPEEVREQLATRFAEAELEAPE